MTRSIQIKSEIQLLVEGNDPRNFFEAFIRHLSLANIQIQNCGGSCARLQTRQGFMRSLKVSALFEMPKCPQRGRFKASGFTKKCRTTRAEQIRKARGRRTSGDSADIAGQ